MKKLPLLKANPGVNESAIRLLEHRFHFRMPPDMEHFYRQYNGATLPPHGYIDPEGCQLQFFHPIGVQYQEHILTINKLLEWQEMDGFIPMYYIPFCSDAAGDSYYIRVDEASYGKVYYIFDEFLDEFLEDPESQGFVANSFSEFLQQIRF